MQNNTVITTEVAQKQQGNRKTRFMVYMQCVKKLEMKARMQAENEKKGGVRA